RLGVLDLAAARTREIALEQRFELDDQRKLVTTTELLLHQIGAHSDGLPHRYRHSVAPLPDLWWQLEVHVLFSHALFGYGSGAETADRVDHLGDQRLRRRGAGGDADPACALQRVRG